MGVDLIPLFGNAFTVYFPILLIFLCIFNLMNIWSRFMNFIGFGRFAFNKDFEPEEIEVGRKMIARARTERERQFLGSNKTNLRDYHGYVAKMFSDSTELESRPGHGNGGNGFSEI